MGTRSGDIDPAVVTYLMRKTGMDADEVENVLNKKSGMLGVSELSSDARDIEAGVNAGNEQAILTQELYICLLYTSRCVSEPDPVSDRFRAQCDLSVPAGQ